MSLQRWSIVMAGVVVVLGIVLAAAAPATPVAQASPAQQLSCSWESIGQSTKDLFHVASAFDTDYNKLYVYGGVDPDFGAQNTVEVADLSGATLRATWRAVTAGSAKNVVGAAGAYRARGKDAADSAVYFFGGISDPSSGQADDFVQRYLVKAARWETVTPTNPTEFKARFFASAAYDPSHDALWVVGGINTCTLSDVQAGSACNARSLATQYLTFDAQGNATWHTLSGADQSLYAAQMVYDAPRKRMLVFTGTSNITRSLGDVWQLDLSNADPSKATLSKVTTQGPGPSTYFNGAIFWAADNWLVAYGGVRQNFMQSTEATDTGTWALNLASTPPQWTNLSPTGSPGPRVAGAMAYDPVHKAGIFAAGRDKYVVTSESEPKSQKAQRATYALSCHAGVGPSTTPTSPTPGTPVTPGTPTVRTPTPTTAPTPQGYEVCDFIRSRVPSAVINAAVGNPSSVKGYRQLCNPNLEPSTWNVLRSHFSLEAGSKPFHPVFNTIVLKCGCP
jgi:hypothetical protein